jgi:hypothetical protein
MGGPMVITVTSPPILFLHLHGRFQGVGIQRVCQRGNSLAHQIAGDGIHLHEVHVRHLLYANKYLQHI